MEETNPTIKEFEKSIYKTFESLGSSSMTVAALLGALDLSSLLPSARASKFSSEALARSFVYVHLKGISQSSLVRLLRESKEDALLLGFKPGRYGKPSVPDQRTFSYWFVKRFPKETISALTVIADMISRTADKFGIVLDAEMVRPVAAVKRVSDRAKLYRRGRKLKELCKLAKKKVYPHVSLPLGRNARYAKGAFLDLLVRMAMERDFAENCSKTLRATERFSVPDADTLLFHVKQNDDTKALQATFAKCFDVIYRLAKQAGMFTKPVDIAIDFTEWPYYGKQAPMVVGKKPERGATKCYKFIALNVVEADERFTLLALPVGTFDNKVTLLEKLLDYAQGKVSIRKVYVDRGFFSIDVINLFKHRGLTYLMPATQNSAIRRMTESMPAGTVVKDYPMGEGSKSTTFNLAILDGEDGKKYTFATNMNISEAEAGLAERLFGLYDKRWGVETSFRVMNMLKAKTTSKNYVVRLFYYLFSVLLYNLWLIVDGLVAKFVHGRTMAKRVVTAKMFGNVLCAVVTELG